MQITPILAAALALGAVSAAPSQPDHSTGSSLSARAPDDSADNYHTFLRFLAGRMLIFPAGALMHTASAEANKAKNAILTHVRRDAAPEPAAIVKRTEAPAHAPIANRGAGIKHFRAKRLDDGHLTATTASNGLLKRLDCVADDIDHCRQCSESTSTCNCWCEHNGLQVCC